jgi:N-carbamoyl-L-amino-acid hydrolase
MVSDMRNIAIDGSRLWDSLMEMAKIGATEKGGSRRLALTDPDREGRDLFIRWCREAGCGIRIDRMGNIFARRRGRRDDLPPVMTGSHLDTQPTGGKFDGVYGVLAGLEVVRALNDRDYETGAPIEVAVWTNEEGSRFAPSMIASGVFAGVYTLEQGLACQDLDGRSIGDELDRIGYAGEERCGETPPGAYFEAHIEQGPILEADGKTIGVVTGAQGLYWYDITVTGMESHAGSTPMNRRRDAMVGAARMVCAIDGIAHDTPDAVATIGMAQVMPNSRNVIAGQVWFTVDCRHPDIGTLEAMDAAIRAACAGVANEMRLELEIDVAEHTPPAVFDPDQVAAVRKAVEKAGYSHMDIVSGGGHDACHINLVAPTAMIFVPCADGISHNELESATPEDLAAGCDVLLRTILTAAEA